VTGAARGLGWGIARAFGLAGARVCVTDIGADELDGCSRNLAEDGTGHLVRVSAVADLAACQRVVQACVERWGRLDVVVHNAIYMPPAEWSRQLQVGLDGLFNCTHAVWSQMQAPDDGRIIGVATSSSMRGFKEEIAYCTIKHGVEGFVKALSFEAAEHNIAINTIGPGAPIKPTRMTRAEYEQTPAKQRDVWPDPVELGRAWVWLAAQPPARFSGYRFDAGPTVATLTNEGDDFAFTPEMATLYSDDFREAGLVR